MVDDGDCSFNSSLRSIVQREATNDATTGPTSLWPIVLSNNSFIHVLI